MIHPSHLNTAAKIIGSYQGGQPFALFIREFFRTDKKYGSRDRKQISHICYCYFRLGRLAVTATVQERILLGLFLIAGDADGLPAEIKGSWIDSVKLPLTDKLRIAGIDFDPEVHFPAADQISEEIDKQAFSLFHFTQPDLFIRLRPAGRDVVPHALEKAGIAFTRTGTSALAMANSTRTDVLLQTDSEAVIQDASSQRVAEFLPAMPSSFRLWDCCAASGGKSIMAIDHYSSAGIDVQLTVSDIRESIMHNLKQRFKRAGIERYKSFVADLGTGASGVRGRYDLILADVPCSGSGTWGRTPEQLYYFNKERIAHYSSLQRKIIDNSLPALAAGGYFLYVTCSVYREENEGAVEHLSGKGLKLLRMEYLTGYHVKADTLFAAIFRA